ANRHFVFDIDASNPAEKQRLIAHLEGRIDNLPPVANAGPSERTVECSSHTTTPVQLSGTASTDPDPTDAITHYQWFDAATSAGLGNTAMITAQLHLGLSKIDLHVYDRILGSNSTEVSVRVVDTTPPVLTVTPADSCIWPPNHKRVRFALG